MAVRNPLAQGVYRLDLPMGDERDRLSVFRRWRLANQHAVKVVSATMYEEPPRARIVFEVASKPGAFPFGQLGRPEPSTVDGAVPTFAEIASFLFNPLGTLEAAALSAARSFVDDLSKPELANLRDAISLAKANVAIVRATLEAVRNGTAPNPGEALAGAANLIRESIAAVSGAAAGVPFAAPKRVIESLLGELKQFAKAIDEAPRTVLKAAANAAKGFVTDVVVPGELGALGGAAAILAGWYLLEGGKRTKTTDYIMLGGVAILLLGGGTAVKNLIFPEVPAKGSL